MSICKARAPAAVHLYEDKVLVSLPLGRLFLILIHKWNPLNKLKTEDLKTANQQSKSKDFIYYSMVEQRISQLCMILFCE